ncbi:MAG: hypothetical protein WA970_11125 [Gammaproteobacteria bacterium]
MGVRGDIGLPGPLLQELQFLLRDRWGARDGTAFPLFQEALELLGESASQGFFFLLHRVVLPKKRQAPTDDKRRPDGKQDRELEPWSVHSGGMDGRQPACNAPPEPFENLNCNANSGAGESPTEGVKKTHFPHNPTPAF